MTETPEQIALSTAERRRAWAALHKIRDAMEELLGPPGAGGDPAHVPSYERETEAIIAELHG